MITNELARKQTCAYQKFVQQTGEKERIAAIIKAYVAIRSEDEVLDVGSSDGSLIRQIQPNAKNITMVDILDQEVKDATYIKEPFETCKLNKTYDLIVASHVWEYFVSAKTSEAVLEKMVNHTADCGNIVLTYNTYAGYLGKLATLVQFESAIAKKEPFNGRVDPFNPELLHPYLENHRLTSERKGYFYTVVRTHTFDELADICRTLFAIPDNEYDAIMPTVTKFLKQELYIPELVIEQQMSIYQKRGA